MQPQQHAQHGIRLNPFGVIGGIIVLISLVLPWVTVLGFVSYNLISLVPEALGSRPMDVALAFGSLFAIIFVLLGGFICFVEPAGGVPSLLAGGVFLAAVQNFVGAGPVVAIIGGITALAGYFFPGLARIIPMGEEPVSEGGHPPSASEATEPWAKAEQESEKFCPTCGERYPSDYRVCPRDTTELKQRQ